MDQRLEEIHIEPTTRCTLGCSECPRTLFPGYYSIKDCDIDLTARMCSNANIVLMCGNFGDPIYHPRFHDLVLRIREMNPEVHFSIITNGAFRSIEWWKQTASMLRAGDAVTFSIDGLPSNNHLYRTNSNWNSIETAIKTLRLAAPEIKMIWKLVIFRYNENDIVEAHRLSLDLGFDSFRLIMSARTDNPTLNPTRTLSEIQEELDACG